MTKRLQTELDSLAHYDQDFYLWTQQQAALLRQGHLIALDLEHLAEEVEDMGKSEKRAVESHLTVLLTHKLKWEYQAQKRARSWRFTIAEQGIQIEKTCQESPGLRPLLPILLEDAYRTARLRAAKETRLSLSIFPKTCPWTVEEILAAAQQEEEAAE
jgi:hypothetical protein